MPSPLDLPETAESNSPPTQMPELLFLLLALPLGVSFIQGKLIRHLVCARCLAGFPQGTLRWLRHVTRFIKSGSQLPSKGSAGSVVNEVRCDRPKMDPARLLKQGGSYLYLLDQPSWEIWEEPQSKTGSLNTQLYWH